MEVGNQVDRKPSLNQKRSLFSKPARVYIFEAPTQDFFLLEEQKKEVAVFPYLKHDYPKTEAGQPLRVLSKNQGTHFANGGKISGTFW